MKTTLANDSLTLFPEGRIDSNNAQTVESELFAAVNACPAAAVSIDAGALEYISSAGLRVLLKLRKASAAPLSIVNVSPDVYDILQTTGFTELLDVHKALESVCVDGLAMIGKGANGAVYRLDRERIVKVYNPVTNPLERIRREKQVARAAFVQGIPSAISYDIVQVGDRYGMIYEMIDAATLGETIVREPDRLEEYAHRAAALLKQLHSTVFEPGALPDAREGLCAWADVARRSGYYSDEVIDALRRLIASIPDGNTFVHGDFHPGNILVSDGEFLLIDMGDASVGDPLVDMLGCYQIMKLAASREGGAKRYTGMSAEQMGRFWNIFLRDYAGTQDESLLFAYEQKLKLYALIRSLPGITFSELIPKAALPALTRDVSLALLQGCERAGI